MVAAPLGQSVGSPLTMKAYEDNIEFYAKRVKPGHWFAYRQVVELAKQFFGEESPDYKSRIKEFNEGQARIARDYESAYPEK